MPLNTTGLNMANDAVAIDGIQVHTGDPTSAGTANVCTGTTKQTITFSASSGGVRTADDANSPAFDIVAGEAVSYLSYWVGTTCVGTKSVPTKTDAADAWVYDLTGATFTAT